MEFWPLVFIAVAGLVAGLISGVSGGGGGMLMIPAFIWAGLPPQVAVATGKMNGLGAAYGGLMAFAKTGHIRKDIIRPLIPVAVIIGLVTPFVFAKIDSTLFQAILGILLIAMVPTLFLKKRSFDAPTKQRRFAGFASYSGILTLQALFGTGVGALALFVLTLLFGTTKLEANATRRAVSAVLVPITFVALLIGGYVNLKFGIVALVAMFIGTHFGSKLAIKKGEEFVTVATAVVVVIAGSSLLISAVS